MDPRISPAIAIAMLSPVAAILLPAAIIEHAQSRRDRADGVVATWAELRLTKTFLILGHRGDAKRIPLTGLRATVTETGSRADGFDGHQVHLTIEGLDGGSIRRSKPYSYGSIGAARMFEILLNRANRRPLTVADTPVADYLDFPYAA